MLTHQDLHAHCRSKTGAEETYPFGEVPVYKVKDKIFALIGTGNPVEISLKCDPTLAGLLRDTYQAVQPGYHLNKRHWNTVTIDGSIPDDEILEMIDNSYDLIVKGLPKAERDTLKEQK